MTDALLADYRGMTGKTRRQLLLVEYRCREGCLLLHVWKSAAGPIYYRPPVRISAGMQFRTGTADVGRVPERAGLLSELSDQQVVWGDAENSILIGCPHCIGLRFPASTVKADASSATPGNPVKNHTFWMAPNPPD